MTKTFNEIATAGCRILVVDDYPLNLELVEAMLSTEGYRIDTAIDGASALEQVRAEPPDLILLDVMMPGMDGYEVCTTIRSDESLPYIPIVFLTAVHTEPNSLVHGLEIGGDDYIRKPFDDFELVSRIRAALRVKVLHDDLIRTKAALSRYVSTPTVQMVEKAHPDRPEANGEIANVTVLFSDIRGFTHIAEEEKPARVFRMLNDLLGRQMKVIREFGGIIDKLNGDEIMAVYEGPEMAVNALRTAAGIRRVLCDNRAIAKDDWAGVGIGIASGPVFVGSLGTDVFKDYTVIGNTVNIAARLCGVASKFQILFTEDTHSLIATPDLQYRRISGVRLKGLSEPQPIYELLD